MNFSTHVHQTKVKLLTRKQESEGYAILARRSGK